MKQKLALMRFGSERQFQEPFFTADYGVNALYELTVTFSRLQMIQKGQVLSVAFSLAIMVLRSEEIKNTIYYV